MVVCGRSTIRSGRGEAAHLYDEEHSREEDRWVTLGRSSRGDILVVVHTFDEQSDGNVAVRIISARQATKREMQRYEANL
ncbi:MAG: BrnT family toxin [Thermoanaerobaculia bacterium]